MKASLTAGNIKKRIAPVLKSHGITRAGLFGSAARGEMKKNSDVDVLIDTKGKLGIFAVVGLKRALEKELDRSVDLVEYSAIKPALRKSILLDHIPLMV